MTTMIAAPPNAQSERLLLEYLLYVCRFTMCPQGTAPFIPLNMCSRSDRLRHFTFVLLGVAFW
ncbi:MAG: hypothetical protein ABJE99_22615 [Roseobacter sp.]